MWFNSRICFQARLWHLGPQRPSWKQRPVGCHVSGNLWSPAIGILSRKPLLPRPSDRVPWSSHISRALGRPTGPAGQPWITRTELCVPGNSYRNRPKWALVISSVRLSSVCGKHAVFYFLEIHFIREREKVERDLSCYTHCPITPYILSSGQGEGTQPHKAALHLS